MLRPARPDLTTEESTTGRATEWVWMRGPRPDNYRDVFDAAAAERDEPEALRADIRRYRSELDMPIDQRLEDSFVAEYTAGRHPGGNWLTDAEEGEIEYRIRLLEAGEPALDQGLIWPNHRRQ